MRILVATNHLKYIGGTESFTYAVIEELRNRQFDVEYFTFETGIVSEKVEDLGVPFFTGGRYDLVLANHYTTVDKLHKHGLTIQTCHGIYPQHEKPSSHADGYVAVSLEIQQHLAERGISSIVVHNGVNCQRFRPVRPISDDLTSVVSLCQSMEANEELSEACRILDVDLKIVGDRQNRVWEVEHLINQGDLVIGLGRSAYDGLACGRPVVVFDMRDYSGQYGDGYLPENLGLSLINNCSGRFFKHSFDTADLVNELRKYRPQDGLLARQLALKLFNIETQVDTYLAYANSLRKRTTPAYHLRKLGRSTSMWFRTAAKTDPDRHQEVRGGEKSRRPKEK